jgi:transcription antitermination factor NusG
MSTRKISDVEAFKNESEKARNIKPNQEDIDHINNLIREAEIEELENEKNEKVPKVAIDQSDSISAQL